MQKGQRMPDDTPDNALDLMDEVQREAEHVSYILRGGSVFDTETEAWRELNDTEISRAVSDLRHTLWSLPRTGIHKAQGPEV